MRKMAMTATLFLLSAIAHGTELSPADQIQQYHQVVPTPAQVKQQIRADIDFRIKPRIRPYIGEQINEAIVVIENIINLGKQIWEIVEAGKPVVAIEYDYANALPKGVDGAEELEGFSPLQFTSFRETGVNGFGYTVYDVTYTVVYRYGGSYKGQGKYLDAVAVVPQRVEVSWLYNVEFKVSKVSVANVGSREAPVASMALESMFKVSTVLKEYQSRGIYEIRGDTSKLSYRF